MLSRHEHRGIVWVDLESPSRDEVKTVMEEFGIEAFVAQELIMPSARPRSDFYSKYIFLVLHFPALKKGHRQREQEIDFIIGKQFIITTHYEAIDPLHKFSKVFEVNSILEHSLVGEHAGFVFFAMLKRLYKAIEHELESVRRDLASIEEHIFSGDEIAMVSAISHVSREFLNIRQTIEPHREILHTLETGGPTFFGIEFTPFLRGMSNEYYRLHNHVMRLTDSLHELRETNNSLLTSKQNETVKILTALAFITIPVSLIASLFDTYTRRTPILDHQTDFIIMLFVLVLVAAFMFMFFKRRKWL